MVGLPLKSKAIGELDWKRGRAGLETGTQLVIDSSCVPFSARPLFCSSQKPGVMELSADVDQGAQNRPTLPAGTELCRAQASV